MSSLYGNTGLAGSSAGMRGPTGQMAQGKRGSTGNIQGYNRIPNFTPEQMELFKSLFGDIGPESFLSRLAAGDESAFAESEAPALRQFSGLQGNIASRFSGMGTGGRHSSGFQNTINQAGSDFAQDLQSRRMGLQNQAIRDLFSMKNSLLGHQPYSYEQKAPGFLESILGYGSQGLGAGLGGLLGKLFGL